MLVDSYNDHSIAKAICETFVPLQMRDDSVVDPQPTDPDFAMLRKKCHDGVSFVSLFSYYFLENCIFILIVGKI